MPTLHVIPVPRGWSTEQAWEAINRGDHLDDPEPAWAVIETTSAFPLGKFIRVIDHDAEE